MDQIDNMGGIGPSGNRTSPRVLSRGSISIDEDGRGRGWNMDLREDSDLFVVNGDWFGRDSSDFPPLHFPLLLPSRLS